MLFKFDSYTIAFHDKKYHVKTGKIFFPVLTCCFEILYGIIAIDIIPARISMIS